MGPFQVFHLNRPALNLANFTKNNDAKIGINLKMISITLGYIALTEEILGSNPFTSIFVIKFNEFIDNLFWEKLH